MKRVPDQDNRPVSFCTNHAEPASFVQNGKTPVLALNWLTRTPVSADPADVLTPLRKGFMTWKIQPLAN
jgi:hypothetical protein